VKTEKQKTKNKNQNKIIHKNSTFFMISKDENTNGNQ